MKIVYTVVMTIPMERAREIERFAAETAEEMGSTDIPVYADSLIGNEEPSLQKLAQEILNAMGPADSVVVHTSKRALGILRQVLKLPDAQTMVVEEVSGGIPLVLTRAQVLRLGTATKNEQLVAA